MVRDVILRHGQPSQEPEAHDDPSHLVDSVDWARGNLVRITYADGSSMPVIAAQTVATVIARDAGLRVIPSPEGTVRWARDTPAMTA
jgi:hypothetical protein